MLIRADIYEAFNVDMKSKPIAVCFDVHSRVRINDKWWVDYLQQVLGINNPSEYFNAGFIIFDIKEYHKNDLHKKMCDAISNLNNIMFADQDIVNSVCNSRYLMLDHSWNYYIFSALTSLEIFSDYAKEISNAKIYHYIDQKPWKNPYAIKAEEWWECANNTPYFNIKLILERIATKTKERYNNFRSIYNFDSHINLSDYTYNLDTSTLDVCCRDIKYKI